MATISVGVHPKNDVLASYEFVGNGHNRQQVRARPMLLSILFGHRQTYSVVALSQQLKRLPKLGMKRVSNLEGLGRKGR